MPAVRQSHTATVKHCPACHAVYRREIEFCFREGTVLVAGEAPIVLADAAGRLDAYAPEGQLAAGDSGVVHLARLASQPYGPELAVKVLDPRATADHRARFLAAYREGRELEAEGLTRVLDLGEQDGVAFATMPRLRGRPLAEVMERVAAIEHAVPPWQALAVVADLAEAVSALHPNGPHGNLHPRQVMFNDDGSVVLLGFRDIFPLDPCAVNGALHRYAYAAPELLRGSAASPASDLYSIAVIAAALLGGGNPLQKEDVSRTVLAVLTDSLELPRKGMPRDARKALAACLDEQAKRRPGSAAEVAAAMRDGIVRLGGPPISTARQTWLTALFAEPTSSVVEVQVTAD